MIRYAVGDIHGCFQQLTAAINWIYKDFKGEESEVIFIGDYMDRGQDSSKVLEFLIAGPTQPNQKWICLKGNHDHYFANAVLRNIEWSNYMNFGSASTFMSYGVVEAETGKIMLPFKESDLIVKHARWIDTLLYDYETEDLFFVHAGVMPEQSLHDQSVNTKIWIRGMFLDSDYDWGKRIIHGHTPNLNGPEIKDNRINIDTGACFGGGLTVVKFDKGMTFKKFM